MSYYILAGEARSEIARAGKEGRGEDEGLWKDRLRDLGIRVASALVEMGDAEGAGRHLRSLEGADGESRRVVVMEALVWLRLGDARAARSCVARLGGRTASMAPVDEPFKVEQSGEESVTDSVLDALLSTANGDFTAATSQWQALHEAFPNDATITQNLAVCLIYIGRMAEAKEIFESLIDSKDTPAFQPLLFNLCTVYELCTGKVNEEKAKLVERVATKVPGETGWEKASIEFKL